MDQSRLIEQGKPIQQLLRKDADQGRAQASELVLLDQLVQVDTKQLEDQAQVLPMNEGIF